MPDPTPYQVVDRGANNNVWERTTYELSPSGEVVPRKHSYTELATGLNYLNNGQWTESKEEIDIQPDGTAAATNGQHQAYFPGDIYNGEIKMVMPDGKVLQSQPLELSYDDGSNTVLIAVLTNSTGELISPNQVLYPNAFAGVDADLRYTYTKAGFEQDVILREQPPTPESLGLNPDTARLQVLTEFFDPPQPTVSAVTVPTDAGDLENDNLDFGVMQMVQGRAFLLGNEANDVQAPVNKQWLLLDGRQILVEEVPVDAIVEGLATLPLPTAQSGSSATTHVVSKHLALPPQRLAKATTKQMMLARTSIPTHGFVLDYQTVNSSVTNYTFQGDTTYYISGSVNLYGTNTFEGGTVLKYTNNASVNLGTGSGLNWLGSAYRPVIFTAKDDNSVGEVISGSTGNPTNYYASTALSFNDTSAFTISYFRIAWAAQAIGGYASQLNIYHGQLVNCRNGINWQYGEAYLRNTLFANVQTNFNSDSAAVDAQNSTFSGSSCLAISSSEGGVYLTNCILANVTHLTNSTAVSISGDYNGFYNCQEFGTDTVTNTFYPFQTVGAGNYYLTNGSPCRNAGTTNIDPTLLAELSQKTTYPPIILETNYLILTNDLTLSPQVQRDTNAAPDLGYHYDPLDYVLFRIYATNSTITINPGTAIGICGLTNIPENSNYGIGLGMNAKIVSQGLANDPVWIVEYNTVQEETTNTTSDPWVTALCTFWNASYASLTCDFQFTDWSIMAQDSYHTYFLYVEDETANFQNCEIYGGQLTTWYPTFNLTNCLFHRVYADLEPGDNNTPVIRNNLFLGGTFSFYPSYTNSIVRDNLFDQASIPDGLGGSGVTYYGGNNAYVTNCNRLDPTYASDVILSNSPAYQSSWFGDYYLPTNSPLRYAGSTTADQVGLYHFTTQTNQTIEANSIVDIGYHYVATDAYGNPIDTDGDGTPDYLKDVNGNGITDPGEAPFAITIENPVNGSVVH